MLWASLSSFGRDIEMRTNAFLSMSWLFALFALLLCACTDYAQKIKDEFDPDDSSEAVGADSVAYGYMTDYRDGQGYRTVKIAGQEWMAENLKYRTTDSYCYDDNYQNCDTYGRLYKWYAALYACPIGWHLPTKTEFETLMGNVGGASTAAAMLKAKLCIARLEYLCYKMIDPPPHYRARDLLNSRFQSP